MMSENAIDTNDLDFGAEGSSEDEMLMEYLDEEERNEVDFGEKPQKRRNWFDRCGDCEGVPEDTVCGQRPKFKIFISSRFRDFTVSNQPQVCGSDGKTYPNSCELEYFSCRRYWAIVEVANYQTTD